MPTTEDARIEQEVFENLCRAHPHEMYAEFPERFWAYFHELRPNLSRECMEMILKATEGDDGADI